MTEDKKVGKNTKKLLEEVRKHGHQQGVWSEAGETFEGCPWEGIQSLEDVWQEAFDEGVEDQADYEENAWRYEEDEDYPDLPEREW